MKKIFTLLVFLSFNALAEDSANIIYKCTDANGSITYSNATSSKKEKKCSKTDLATVDKQSSTPKPNKQNESPLELIVPGINKPPIGLPNTNSKLAIDPSVEVIQKPIEQKDGTKDTRENRDNIPKK